MGDTSCQNLNLLSPASGCCLDAQLSNTEEQSVIRDRKRKQPFPRRNGPIITIESCNGRVVKRCRVEKLPVSVVKPNLSHRNTSLQCTVSSSQSPPSNIISSQQLKSPSKHITCITLPMSLQTCIATDSSQASLISTLSGRWKHSITSLCSPPTPETSVQRLQTCQSHPTSDVERNTSQRTNPKPSAGPNRTAADDGSRLPYQAILEAMNLSESSSHLDTTPHINTSSSNLIKNMLRVPAASSTTSSSAVSDIVSSIVSRAKPAQPQKYVVMPVMHPTTMTKPNVKYVLLDTLSSSSSKPAGARQKCRPNVPLCPPAASSHQDASRVNCCTAVISAIVDTVQKWMNCNRDILSKTLISVSEKLKLCSVVSTLMSSYRDQPAEHHALKWIAIALLTLTRRQVNIVIGGSGRPIPSYLYSMWNNLRSFFTVYEGCLLLGRTQPMKTTLSDKLRAEDATFEHIITRMFTAYNEVFGEDVPLPSNMPRLVEFIESLNDHQASSSVHHTPTSRTITSVLYSQAVQNGMRQYCNLPYNRHNYQQATRGNK